jgi:gluconate 2-dehydrogenase gamma chain
MSEEGVCHAPFVGTATFAFVPEFPRLNPLPFPREYRYSGERDPQPRGEAAPMDWNQGTARKFSVLMPDEAETLAAIADRIFPKTDTPGAVEIGALEYIDAALAGDYAPLLPLYHQGLRFIDRYARAKYGAVFMELTGEQKDGVLAEFESGDVAGFKRAAEFFEMVRYHVLEGVFCEPSYGGNRGMIGWRLVNFPGQQLGYTDAYINKPVDLEPVAVDGAEAEDK